MQLHTNRYTPSHLCSICSSCKSSSCCSAPKTSCLAILLTFPSAIITPSCCPAGLLYAGSLWLSNSSYLYLSVSFIQMTKSLMPGLVYAAGCVVGTESFRPAVALNMGLIALGVLVCALGEVNLVLLGLAQQLTALGFEVGGGPAVRPGLVCVATWVGMTAGAGAMGPTALGCQVGGEAGGGAGDGCSSSQQRHACMVHVYAHQLVTAEVSSMCPHRTCCSLREVIWLR